MASKYRVDLAFLAVQADLTMDLTMDLTWADLADLAILTTALTWADITMLEIISQTKE